MHKATSPMIAGSGRRPVSGVLAVPAASEDSLSVAGRDTGLAELKPFLQELVRYLDRAGRPEEAAGYQRRLDELGSGR